MSANTAAVEKNRVTDTDVVMILARFIVGGVFIWLALPKIADPLEFLKVLKEYELLPTQPQYVMNLTAVALPWIELICGLFLVAGFWVRGVSLLVVVMLIAFTSAVFMRAWGVHVAEGVPLCSIKFDCGCGGGTEIPVCDKFRENVAILGLAVIAFVSKSRRFGIDSLSARKRSQ